MAKASTATDALEAYRRSLLTDDVEKRIAELAEVVATHDSNEASRQRELAKLTATKWWTDEESLSTFLSRARAIAERGWADQDAVLVAFEAAKDAGAKPSTLQEIGLRPDAALAAARSRAKESAEPTATAGQTRPPSTPVASPTPNGQNVSAVIDREDRP